MFIIQSRAEMEQKKAIQEICMPIKQLYLFSTRYKQAPTENVPQHMILLNQGHS